MTRNFPFTLIRRSGRLPAFAVIFLAMIGGSATAQQLADASLDQLLEMKVYSASRHDQSLADAPASVTIVTRDQIQRYGYRTLADLLRSVRGFFVTNDRNYSYLGARGFGPPGDYNTRILLMIDGHRLNESVYDAALIGTEFPLDMDLVERVEIVRGPASSLYGANAFFGVINVITREPRSIQKLELSSGAASFNTYNGRITYGQHFSSIDVMLSGSYYSSRGHNQLFFPEFNSPETNFGISSHNDDDRSGNLFSTISARGFTLQLDYGSREKGIPTASFGTVFNTSLTRTLDERGYADLSYDHAFADGWTIRARGYFDRYIYDGTYLYAYDPTSPDVVTMNMDSANGKWWGTEFQASRLVFRKHKLTAGTEFRRNLNQDQKNYDAIPFFMYINDHRTSSATSGYVQDEFSILKTLTLNAGLRLDAFGQYDLRVSPRAALIYRPRKSTALKLIYGDAFRPPNSYELYYVSPNFSGPRTLSPEKIRTYEAVWEQKLNKRLQLSFSGYGNDIRGLISQISDPNGNVGFRNLRNAISHGAEAELIGKWTTGWEGSVSYSFQQTSDAQTGQTLTNSPRHLVKLDMTAPLLARKLFASVDAQNTSARGTLAGNEIPGFPMFNLTLLGRNLIHHLDLSASLYNAFNRTYFDPGAAEHRQDTLPQDGRNFRLKMTWRLGE